MIAEGAPWWMVVLAIAGLLAIAGVLVSLFLSAGRRTTHLESGVDIPTGSSEFVVAVSRLLNLPLLRGGAIEPIEDGDAILEAICRDVAGARASVNVAVYFWQEGRSSERLWGALIERAAAGVEVRLLLDGFGAATASPDRIAKLERAGGRVAWFRPVAFGKLGRFHRRNHRRAIVMDGRIAYTGGWGVGDDWLEGAEGAPGWRDSMYRCTGPAVAGLQTAFAASWASADGEILAGQQFFPPLEDGASGAAHLHVVSSPTADVHPVRALFYVSVGQARERVLIATSYFCPDRGIRRLMRRRAREGVEVILVTAGAHTDARPVWYAGRAYYESLLKAGVRIFEYAPTHYHRKVMVVDGVWTVVGSANFDIRSKELNEENLLAVADGELGAATERSIREDTGRSHEILYADWRRRGLLDRALERFFVMFSNQY